MIPPSPPVASVVVPTYNRRENLRECLLAAGRQSVPVELIVVDDGSDDGTAEMMRKEFPHAKYKRFEGGPHGPAFIRNRGSEMATAPILFPIDDDAVMVSPRTVEQTLTEFDHPRVGAVGIPFVNVSQNDTVQQRAPGDDGCVYVCLAYVGASHALRRDVFLEQGGYREELFYMGEESDYCLRMVAAGYVTRLGRADPIHHHESPQRSFWRMDYYGWRNNILFAWHNAPRNVLAWAMLKVTVSGLRHVIGLRRSPWATLRGLRDGFLMCLRRKAVRQPVPPLIYQLGRRLARQEPLAFSEIELTLESALSRSPHHAP